MTQIKDRRIRKFNPGIFQSDQEVIEQFVLRQHELTTVLDILRGNIDSPSCQHTLIVAPRGRGKTMLLARTAAELRVSDEFSDTLLPVRFMEESQEIFKMADFWLETLFYLSKECARTAPELAKELEARHAALAKKWDSDMLEDRARIAVLDAADRLGRKLVLMIENLQSLYKDVDKDFGWELRKVLQTEPQLMLLGSATSRFEGLVDSRLPFFEFFRIIDLRPLNTGECRDLWKAVSGDNVQGREVRPLEILTGGSPRLLVIIAGFAQHKSMRQLMEELVLLVDEHTEYFRGHLEALAKNERRVYLAIIDLWQLSTPSEISARARIDIRVVSTMLKRLVDRGLVIVEGGGRKRRYAAAERLYTIYYKVRRGRDEAAVVQNLIRFMAVFYTQAERNEVFSALVRDAAKSPSIRDGLERFMVGSPEFSSLLAGKYRPTAIDQQSRADDRPLAELAQRANLTQRIEDIQEQLREEIINGLETNAFEQVVRTIDRIFTSENSEISELPEQFLAWALLKKGDALVHLADLDSGLATFAQIVVRYGAREDSREHVAKALLRKSEILQEQGSLRLAIMACDEVVERFGAIEDLALQLAVGSALTFKWLSLLMQGQRESAEFACKAVVQHIVTADDPVLQLNDCLALIGKRGAVIDADALDTDLAICEALIRSYRNTNDSRLKDLVGAALLNKGRILLKHGKWRKASRINKKAIRRLRHTENPTLHCMIADALMNKGHVLNNQDKWDLAFAAFHEVVERFESSEDPKLRLKVAQAWLHRSLVLEESGDLGLAMSGFEEIVERYGGIDDPRLQGQLTLVQILHILALEESGELEAAISVYKSMIERSDSRQYPNREGFIVWALIETAVFQLEIEQTERALDTYEELKQRLSSLSEGIDYWLTGRTMYLAARLNLTQGNIRGAIDKFRLVYKEYEPESETLIQELVELAVGLVAAGAPGRALLDILLSDGAKGAPLSPLVVALLQEEGEPVRAPDEILNVADDIRDRIRERRSQ